MSAATQRRLQACSDNERSALLDELAATAAAGNHDAIADLAWAIRTFRLARPALHTYLFKEHDLEIAEQRTLVAVALRIDSFRSEAKFTTWLHRVALNEAKQFIRGEARRNKHLAADPTEEYAEQFIARVSSIIVDRQQIERAIESLPDNYRQALLLREEQGLSYADLATELDIPEATAKTWVRRARMRLAELLSPDKPT